MLTQKELIELALEIEEQDPIDWSGTSITADQVYNLLSLSILEYSSSIDPKLLPITLLAVVLKLTAENFVLNLKLLQNEL